MTLLSVLVWIGCTGDSNPPQNSPNPAAIPESTPQGIISGIIRGLNPATSTVTLKKLNDKNFLVNVANTQLDSEGSFEFDAKATSEYGYYQLFAGGHALVLVTGPNEDLFIEVDAVEGEVLSPAQDSRIPQTRAVAAYYDVIFPLNKVFDKKN